MTRKLILLLNLLVLAAASCSKSDTSKSGPPEVSGTTQKTASGLQYWDVVTGSGQTAVSGKTVKVPFTGWFTDGKEFDSSVDHGKRCQVTLCIAQVIRGWGEGIARV